MCFGQQKTPKPPKPMAPPPTPKAPPAPKPVAPRQQLKIQEDTAVREPEGQSQRKREGINQGSSSLKIPLNTGTTTSGGLNV